MGVYHEDKLLLAKKDGNDLEKMYFEGLQRVEKMFDEFNGVILLRRIDVGEKYEISNPDGKPIPPIALPVEYPMYVDSMGAINVRYSKGAPQRQGKSIIYPVNKLFVSNFLSLTKANKDFAWVLLEVTNFVRQKGREDLGNAAFLKIEDPKEEIREKASEVKRISQVDAHLIFGDSVLLNEQAIQLIADKFGTNIESSDSVEMSAFLIREDVLNGDKAKNPDVNIKSFLAFAEKLKKKFQPKESVNTEDPGSTGDNSPLVVKLGEYTAEYLDGLVVADRNAISKDLGTDTPPRCNKADQIAQILEKQEELKQ